MENNKKNTSVAIKKKPMRKKRTAFILFFTVIPVIQWLIFYVYVNASSFLMAFTDRHGAISFDNFVRLWGDLSYSGSDLRMSIRNTFLTFGILVVAYPFKVLVSYFLYKKVPGSSIYRILFFLPTIIFSVAQTLIFQRIIGVDGFIAQGYQEWKGLKDVPVFLADSDYANITVLLHMIWLQFPGDLIIWGGTFSRIPGDVLESGRIDGVNWWQEFTRLIVPLIWPTFGLQMVLLACGMFGASGEVFLLTQGNYGTMTLPCWIYLQLLQSSGDRYSSNVYNYMSAVGMIMTIIAITISLFIRKKTDKVFNDVEF